MKTVKHTDSEPTQRQLAELRRLGASTGIRAGVPKTRAQASRRIDQLRSVKPLSGLETRIARDLPGLADSGIRDASAFADDEVEGYGSSARFAGSR